MITSKDNKGRNLKQNEDQLKDGRYRYRYTDKNGQRRAIYSWKLVPSDRIPPGKKDDLSLREKIKAIERDLEDGITFSDSNESVSVLITKYLDSKGNLANATINNYRHMLDKNIKDTWFGSKKWKEIKKSDVLKFYTELSKKGFSPGTLQLYQNLIYPAFQMAVEDEMLRINPCKGCMREYTKGALTTSKNALSRDEQQSLIDFVSSCNIYSSYYTLIVFMLGTGCRISEALGLTWNNVNFEDKYITVDHQIIYKKKDGKIQYYSAPTKNKKTRIVPLQDSVYDVLLDYYNETYHVSSVLGFEVDGYKEFVFFNREGKIRTPNSIVRAFHGIRDAHNNEYELDPTGKVELPDFSPHTLRHTFCTRMAENGLDSRVLQEIMGHTNISITMQVYNHVSKERAMSGVYNMPDVLKTNNEMLVTQ